MPKEILLKVWEVRWNRVFLWYDWYTEWKRKRGLVKVKCLWCWEIKTILKECFIEWRQCRKCFQAIRWKEFWEQAKTHWLWQTRFYHIYYSIKWRCQWYWKLWKQYYYDKWIKCERETFKQFKDDMYEPYLEHIKQYWEKQTTIDRIDNNWNYCKDNCRWATIWEQKRNTTRNIFYRFNWKVLCEKDLRNITWLTKTMVRKTYKQL